MSSTQPDVEMSRDAQRRRPLVLEVIRAQEVLARGLSDTEAETSEAANETARNGKASCDLPSDGSASAS